LVAQGDTLGLHYANELTRHFDSTMPMRSGGPRGDHADQARFG
jgi:hypothetical protein